MNFKTVLAAIDSEITRLERARDTLAALHSSGSPVAEEDQES
jgi:hypothetical protein